MGRIALLAAAVLMVASCGDLPTPPTGAAPTPQAPSAAINIGDITPGSGATLVFRECGVARLCTDQIQTSFDVLVPADLETVVVVSLRRGSMPCAAAYLPATLTKGTLTPFKTSSLAVMYDEEGSALCPMPTESTGLTFEVYYKNAPAFPFLTREVPNRYGLATQ